MNVADYFNSLSLPRIAANINGEFLEHSIIGFRTTSVKGRHESSFEIKETKAGNGASRYRGKTLSTKKLTIEFNITSANELVHFSNMNKLNLLVNDEVKIRFLDEYDKYYIGTVDSITTEELDTSGHTSLLSTNGTISIHLTDPLKYSVDEFEAQIVNFGQDRSECLTDESLSPVMNTAYPIKAYPMVLRPSEGKIAVIQIKGALASNRQCWGIYNSGGSVNMTFLDSSNYQNGVWTKTFTWKTGNAANTHVNIYPMVFNASGGLAMPNPPVNTIPSQIEWVKISIDTPETGNVFLIDYQGTAPSFPTFEILNSNNNPFIALINDREQILQFGDATEIDTIKNPESYGNLVYYEDVTTEESVRLASTNYFQGWLTGQKSFHSADGCVAGGSAGTVVVNGRTILKLNSVPAGPCWRGETRTFNLPVNSDGTTGAINFYAWFRNIFEITGPTQYGYQMISFIGDNNLELFSVTLEKGSYDDSKNNMTARIHWRSEGSTKIYRSINFNASNVGGNPWRRAGSGPNDLLVDDGKMRIYTGGIGSSTYETFDIPDAYKNKWVRKIQVFLGIRGDQSLAQATPFNFIGDVSFDRLRVPVTNKVARVLGQPAPITKNVIKKLNSGDHLIVDCKEGSFTINGLPADGHGALGNDWEKFYLRPGINQIRCVSSAKVGLPPEFKMKYREAYI